MKICQTLPVIFNHTESHILPVIFNHTESHSFVVMLYDAADILFVQH